MKKSILIIILIVALLFMYVPSVYALGFTISLTSNKTTAVSGEEVIITVATSNLLIGGSGMNVLTGVLQYDNNVFETVTTANFTGVNNWAISYNATTGKIFCENDEYSTKDENLFTIKLKLKSSISSSIEYTEVKITSPQTSNASIDILGTDGSIKIYLNKISSSVYEIKADNTIRKIKPGTTIETFKGNITGGSSLVIKDKDGVVKTTGNINTGDLAKDNAGNTYTLIVMGDLNGKDGMDIVDRALLIRYLVGLEQLSGIYWHAADVNHDGTVDIIDAAKTLRVLVELETF